MPFTTVFARSFYIGVPQELVKAAKVDGAGFFRIFWSVMLPISVPILMVSVICQFTNIWNDFLFGAALTYGKGAPIMVRAEQHREHQHRREARTTSTWRPPCSRRFRR